MDLREYQRLKDNADRLQRQADETAGALKQIRSRLREEFGCRTPEEAERLLAELEREERALEKELARELARFEKKWEKRLGGNNGKG